MQTVLNTVESVSIFPENNQDTFIAKNIQGANWCHGFCRAQHWRIVNWQIKNSKIDDQTYRPCCDRCINILFLQERLIKDIPCSSVKLQTQKKKKTANKSKKRGKKKYPPKTQTIEKRVQEINTVLEKTDKPLQISEISELTGISKNYVYLLLEKYCCNIQSCIINVSCGKKVYVLSTNLISYEKFLKWRISVEEKILQILAVDRKPKNLKEIINEIEQKYSNPDIPISYRNRGYITNTLNKLVSLGKIADRTIHIERMPRHYYVLMQDKLLLKNLIAAE